MAKVGGMEQLITHIKAAGLSRKDFAKSVGISAPYLTQILTGVKRPSLDLAFRIQDTTAGAVPAACWVSHHEPSDKADCGARKAAE